MPNFNKLNVGAFDDIAWEGSSSKDTIGVTRYDSDVYRLKTGKPVQIRFITDPEAMGFEPELCLRSTADGSWVKYREVAAWEDVKSKNNPEGRVSHVFIPVADYELAGSNSRKDRKDPVQRSLRASDRDLADPKWGRPYPKAKDMMIVSVVYEEGQFGSDPLYDPEPGSVILLALSPLQAKALGEEMQTVKKYVSDFSFTTGVWTLVWDNPTPKNPSNWSLSLSQDREAPPLSSAPEPLDARQVLLNIRKATEQDLFGLDEALAALEDIADEEAVAAFEEAASVEDVAAEEDVAVPDSPKAKQRLQPKVAKAKAPSGDNPFKRRSPAWVKGMLKKHKVDFDPGVPNDVLYEIAYESLPHDIAA
jgi:hypothetical protein